MELNTGEREHNRDVDWALASVLNFMNKDKLLLIPGKRPWEIGTTKLKGKENQWFTFNGENMFPMPVKKIPKNIMSLLGHFEGTKQKYHTLKQKSFYSLCPNEKAYYNYSNEMCGWSAITFSVVDFICKTIYNHIPEIKYDYLKLEKYINFYWE